MAKATHGSVPELAMTPLNWCMLHTGVSSIQHRLAYYGGLAVVDQAVK